MPKGEPRIPTRAPSPPELPPLRSRIPSATVDREIRYILSTHGVREVLNGLRVRPQNDSHSS